MTAAPPLDYAAALSRLYALAPRGARLGLDRVRAAADALGGVQEIGSYAHIAGTNGKGSTAAFVAQIGREAGATVGLYTSPHLCRFGERIRINGEPADDDLLAYAIGRALGVRDDLTFFEVATLAALVAFREVGVDLWVMEVGIGGRLDATNIVSGRAVSVITRVAFDHMDVLGGSLRKIAREKAGVLRPRAPCVVGRLHPDAREEIDTEAARLGVHVYTATTDDETQMVDLYPPRLPGGFQRQNAMVAVATARALGLPEQAIAEGLIATEWPGRFEIIESPDGFVVLDCAHNADGALALKNSLHGISTSFSRRQIALVFGTMADKNWRAMLDRLVSVSGPRVYVEPPAHGRNPARAEDLVAYADGDVAINVADALQIARGRVGKNGVVVVAGSTFLVGAARALLLDIPSDPAVGL